MAPHKTAAMYLSLIIGLALCATQVQSQTVAAGDIADYPVQEDNDEVADPEVQEEQLQEQDQVLDVTVDKQDAQNAVAEAAQETEIALQRQEEELAHDIEMSRKIERQDAEMAAYLKSQRLHMVR